MKGSIIIKKCTDTKKLWPLVKSKIRDKITRTENVDFLYNTLGDHFTQNPILIVEICIKTQDNQKKKHDFDTPLKYGT